MQDGPVLSDELFPKRCVLLPRGALNTLPFQHLHHLLHYLIGHLVHFLLCFMRFHFEANHDRELLSLGDQLPSRQVVQKRVAVVPVGETRQQAVGVSFDSQVIGKFKQPHSNIHDLTVHLLLLQMRIMIAAFPQNRDNALDPDALGGVLLLAQQTKNGVHNRTLMFWVGSESFHQHSAHLLQRLPTVAISCGLADVVKKTQVAQSLFPLATVA
mmetsp:Transcript_55980/g.149292  ORF Transcript_55980/g.149292 Transcript_55980/m.149292 type:complete len:213 (-) Transcript_55980:557-1195(-)